jgi:hypothetical protein
MELMSGVHNMNVIRFSMKNVIEQNENKYAVQQTTTQVISW